MKPYYLISIGVVGCLLCSSVLPVRYYPSVFHTTAIVHPFDVGRVGEHVEQSWFASPPAPSEVAVVSGAVR
jgi:hypothetical protein